MEIVLNLRSIYQIFSFLLGLFQYFLVISDHSLEKGIEFRPKLLKLHKLAFLFSYFSAWACFKSSHKKGHNKLFNNFSQLRL